MKKEGIWSDKGLKTMVEQIKDRKERGRGIWQREVNINYNMLFLS